LKSDHTMRSCRAASLHAGRPIFLSAASHACTRRITQKALCRVYGARREAFALVTADGADIGANEHDKPVSVSWRVLSKWRGKGPADFIKPKF
jgi:hypothetical protein